MNREELVTYLKTLQGKPKNAVLYSEVLEILRTKAGNNNSFYESLQSIGIVGSDSYLGEKAQNMLNAFISYLEAGLLDISFERRLQIETVSDYMEQAQNLLTDTKMHPAAATVVIGASLEEFLRNWAESEALLTGGEDSINDYAQLLYGKSFINKQDIKDITSWSGLRNDAAHGDFEKVTDREKIGNMLQGVNLFMRKYSSL